MDYGKLFYSIIVPWHNEWLAILLYLGFGLYFLIETFFIIFKHSSYKFKYHNDYEFMFVATFGIAASLLTTAFYLILYSKS
jgi:putative Mn2+ efflux pump MntP